MTTLAVTAVRISSGITLSYAGWSGPEPTLVLLPGPTDSWRSYRQVLELLPPSFGVVAVSQRGHGDSDKPRTGYRVEDFASDVLPFLDALDVQQTVIVGHSGSCLVARRVALDHADRVAGLVLEASPTTLKGNAALDRFVDTTLSTMTDPIDSNLARSFIADTSSDDLPASLLDELTTELLKVPATVWKQTFAGLQVYDDTAELERINVPALLAWGSVDGLVTRSMQADLAARIPGAKLRIYEGMGHTPRWEDPNRFATDVADFVMAIATRRHRRPRLGENFSKSQGSPLDAHRSPPVPW
jgi:pimeloyl-ACP methyl ester carboxylesterase